MPHTRSAKKRLRQNEKRRLHNRSIRGSVKTQIKKVLAVAASGSVDELREQVRLAAKKLDKAAAKRVVHRNLAARKKAQLARLLQKKETGGPAAAK